MESATLIEIPFPYRRIFEVFGNFNAVQSSLLDELLHSDKSVVLSAPTGSGKTVVFELAIVRMLLQETNTASLDTGSSLSAVKAKAVYVAPIKALCSEKFDDWKVRFSAADVQCVLITGDTEPEEVKHLRAAQVVITTPEKWDSLTRHWRDYREVITAVRLFMIDEVHLLNEDVRGPVLEAIVSRMNTIGRDALMNAVRYVVASATIPNVHDITRWIAGVAQGYPYANDTSCVAQLVFAENQRPVPLEKYVVGFNSRLRGFKFDISLNYKLVGVLKKYADGKATLIFCNSRKSTEMGADVLKKDYSACFPLSDQQKANLAQLAQSLHDPKLRTLAACGIAFHHAGVGQGDRCLIEESFRQGHLMILLCTNTLAMGVNLPARLVVIKSTETYYCGSLTEYSESTLIQMIGRAGRPKYDTKGVAVILTHMKNVRKYENLMNGEMPVESHLHKHLAEHLNSEIALGTIKNLEVAMIWMRSTYFYVRAIKNPLHYGLYTNLDKDIIEKKLEEMCLKHIYALQQTGLLRKCPPNELDVQTTDYGKLMAKYYLNFETMKLFRQLCGTETFAEILDLIVRCKEFNDFTLRVSEKRCLNELNDTPLRFPIVGRIKTRENKISCLIQALLGNIEIPVSGLAQESVKMLRIGDRIAKCLLEYMRLSVSQAGEFHLGCYQALLHTATIAKCFHAKLWENSKCAVRQLQKIDAVYTGLLANAGKSAFKSLAETDARTIESLLNKSSQFGAKVLENLNTFPNYSLELKRQSTNLLHIRVMQNNTEYFSGGTNTVIIVGDSSNNLLLHIENLDAILLEYGVFMRSIKVPDATVEEVYAHIIHSTLVGVDKKVTIVLNEVTNDVTSVETKKCGKRKMQTMLQFPNTKKKKQDTISSPVETIQLKSNNRFSVLSKFSYSKCKLQHTSEVTDLCSNLDKSFYESKCVESNYENASNTNNYSTKTAQNKPNLVQAKLTKYFNGKKQLNTNAPQTDEYSSKINVSHGEMYEVVGDIDRNQQTQKNFKFCADSHVTTPISHDLSTLSTFQASPNSPFSQHKINLQYAVASKATSLVSKPAKLDEGRVQRDHSIFLPAVDNELQLNTVNTNNPNDENQAPLDLSKKPQLALNTRERLNTRQTFIPFSNGQLESVNSRNKHGHDYIRNAFNGCLSNNLNVLDLSRPPVKRSQLNPYTQAQSCSDMSVSFNSSIPMTPTSIKDEYLLQWYRVTQDFLQLREEERSFSHFKKLCQRIQHTNVTINHITTKLHRSTINESETVDLSKDNTCTNLKKSARQSGAFDLIKQNSSPTRLTQNYNQAKDLSKLPIATYNNNPFRLQIFKNARDITANNTNHKAIKNINKNVMDFVLSMKCENNSDNINERMEFDYSGTLEDQLQSRQTQAEPKLTFEEYCRLFFDTT